MGGKANLTKKGYAASPSPIIHISCSALAHSYRGGLAHTRGLPTLFNRSFSGDKPSEIPPERRSTYAGHYFFRPTNTRGEDQVINTTPNHNSVFGGDSEERKIPSSHVSSPATRKNNILFVLPPASNYSFLPTTQTEGGVYIQQPPPRKEKHRGEG